MIQSPTTLGKPSTIAKNEAMDKRSGMKTPASHCAIPVLHGVDVKKKDTHGPPKTGTTPIGSRPRRCNVIMAMLVLLVIRPVLTNPIGSVSTKKSATTSKKMEN